MTTKKGGISRPPFVLLRLPRRGEGFCVPVKKVFHPREARAASGGPKLTKTGKIGKKNRKNQIQAPTTKARPINKNTTKPKNKKKRKPHTN